MNKTVKTVKLDKVVSEKSFAMADANAKYTFYVDKDASKVEIAKAVAAQYKVKVVDVKTVTRPGKLKKDWKKNIARRNPDTKKAIVSLKKGESIKDFVKI